MATHADLAQAIEDALRAPSVHNTQPWLWRIRPAAVELHADWTRHLPATDPDRRDLVLSCGAALHHLRVALAARGFGVDVVRRPDAEDRGFLASVEVTDGRADPVDAALHPGIATRRTDRRRMSRSPVPRQHLAALADHAARAGAVLLPVSDKATRERLAAALADAAAHQQPVAGYATELRQWTSRYPGSRDGVPATNLARPLVGASTPSPLRRFPRGRLAQPQGGTDRPTGDAADLLVVATPGDDVLDQLRAGEAISAVLLAATGLGLATTPLSQAIELASSRQQLRGEVLRIPEHPQLLIRVGWPATGADPINPSPRRALRSVLLP